MEPLRALLKNGGNSKIKNCKGLTASNIALDNGSIKIGDMQQVSEMQRRFYSDINDDQPPSYDDAPNQTKRGNEKPDEVSAKSSSRENEVSLSEQGLKEEMIKQNSEEKQHTTPSFDDSDNETRGGFRVQKKVVTNFCKIDTIYIKVIALIFVVIVVVIIIIANVAILLLL